MGWENLVLMIHNIEIILTTRFQRKWAQSSPRIFSRNICSVGVKIVRMSTTCCRCLNDVSVDLYWIEDSSTLVDEYLFFIFKWTPYHWQLQQTELSRPDCTKRQSSKIRIGDLSSVASTQAGDNNLSLGRWARCINPTLWMTWGE